MPRKWKKKNRKKSSSIWSKTVRIWNKKQRSLRHSLSRERCFVCFGYAKAEIRFCRNPLTVVSNGFVECQYHKMEHTGLLPYFKHIVLSEEVNIQKPNPQIFEKAMAMNRTEMPDLQKDEVVMIGDSYTSDIAGAKAAGIDSIWVLAGEATDEQRKDATYIVPHLRDVMTIL